MVITESMITSRMIALPVEVADIDETAMLDGKPATRACATSD